MRVVILLAGIVLVVWVALQSFHVTYRSTEQLSYNRNVGELTGEREVGQMLESIRPNLAGVAFQIATYGGRTNTSDVIFELRHRPEDPEPLRHVVTNARAFGDHQLTVFSFDPIRDAQGKTFYASLRSPESVPGNAITVDYSNANPYEKGTASTMVLLPNARSALPTYDGTIKTHADTVFAVYHRVTLWEFSRLTATDTIREWRHSIQEHPGRYWFNLRLGMVAVLLAILSLRFRGRLATTLDRPTVLPVLFGGLLLVGFGVRLLYVRELPYTNDEGSYLYDARTILERALPGGDGLAKSPVAVGAFALGIAVLGNTLTAGRIVSVVAGLLTALPLFLLGRHIGGRHAGMVAAGIWLLASVPALFNAYGHTQSVQLLFAVAALAAIVWGIERHRWQWFLLGGLLLGVSVAARKSSLALGVPVLFLLLMNTMPWREKLRRILMVGVGFAIALAIFLGFVGMLYGPVGVRYATGVDLAKTSIEQLDSRGDLYATYSVKGILPFFRESLPVIFLSLVMLGRGLERSLRRYGWLASKAGWLVPLALTWRGGVFLQRFEEEVHFFYGLWPFWVTMGIVLAVLAIVPFRRSGAGSRAGDDRQEKFPVLFPVVWFLAVGFFYAFWVKFHANYILEFLPALVLLAALGAQWITRAFLRSRVLIWGLVALLTWGAYSASQSGYHFSHTGTFHGSSIEEAAEILQRDVPPGELVLTGAVIIPYRSGHHVPFNVAHPTWYGYGYIEPELRNVFMASTEEMVRSVAQDVRWVVRERLTEFSYLREYPEIEKTLAESFTAVTEIENLSNPITILKRTR